MSIEADREAVLLARIERLSHDVAGQAKAIERLVQDRDYWRNRCQRQDQRIAKLFDLQEEARG